MAGTSRIPLDHIRHNLREGYSPAKPAGISSPTFYRYFKDKCELFVETIEYMLRNFNKQIRQTLSFINQRLLTPPVKSVVMI